MSIKNQSSYFTLLLILLTLNVETKPAQSTTDAENNNISERVARIQEVFKQKYMSLDHESTQKLIQDKNINDNEISIWGDWADGGRRGGSGGWVDAWTPGWGDWADTPRWADWADLW